MITSRRCSDAGMSLKHVHLIFIAMATLLLAGCAVWCFSQGGIAGVIGGVVAALCTGGLLFYGVLFWKKINQIIT